MLKEIQLGGWGFMLGDFYKDGKLDEFALETWLWKLSNVGVNRWRFGPCDIWNGVAKIEDVFSPVMLVNGKFDWTKWNPEYFTVWKRIYTLCNKYGIRPVRELLDNCQLKGGDAPRFSPFVTSHQGYNFYDKVGDKWTRLWIEKNFQEFAGLCDFGQCNEGTAGIIDLADRLLNPLFKEHFLVPLTYGICSTPGNPKGPLETLKARAATFFGLDANGKEKALGIFRQTHGCGSVADPDFQWPLSQWGKACPIAIMISDDGVFDGDSTWDRVMGSNGKPQVRPSEPTWYAMVKGALLNKNNDLYLWFEHTGKLQDIDKQVLTYEAMAQAIHDVDKVWLANRGKYPKPVEPLPPGPVDPGPGPVIPPPAGKLWLRRNWGWVAFAVLLIGAAILIF